MGEKKGFFLIEILLITLKPFLDMAKKVALVYIRECFFLYLKVVIMRNMFQRASSFFSKRAKSSLPMINKLKHATVISCFVISGMTVTGCASSGEDFGGISFFPPTPVESEYSQVPEQEELPRHLRYQRQMPPQDYEEYSQRSERYEYQQRAPRGETLRDFQRQARGLRQEAYVYDSYNGIMSGSRGNCYECGEEKVKLFGFFTERYIECAPIDCRNGYPIRGEGNTVFSDRGRGWQRKFLK